MSPRSRTTPFLFTVAIGVAACERNAPTTSDWSADEAAILEASLVAAETAGAPFAALTAAQRQLFERGRLVFATEFTPGTGLGPLFNAEGCANCHNNPVTGGFSGRGETHATAWDGARCDDLAALGGPVFQEDFTPALAESLGITAETPPPQATFIAERSTPDVFGFGLLDAIPDQTMLVLQDPHDFNRDGISGRAHRTPDGRVGRFGRKAQVASLNAFNAEAWVMEQGITNPDLAIEQIPHGQPFPAGVDPLPEPELSRESLDAGNAFVRFLAPPRRMPLDAGGVRGAVLFVAIGCASCHVPALRTGRHPVQALDRKWVALYSDLLLHDMGPALADICFGQATPSEFRTEPLMGLRFSTEFLHDGRVRTVEEAILLHGGGPSKPAAHPYLPISIWPPTETTSVEKWVGPRSSAGTGPITAVHWMSSNRRYISSASTKSTPRKPGFPTVKPGAIPSCQADPVPVTLPVSLGNAWNPLSWAIPVRIPRW